jgi:hypothetical protein
MKKWFNKQTFVSFIIGAFLFSGMSVFAAVELNVVPNPFPVLIDGVSASVDAYNINGFTYLKLADMRQTGLKVMFNETDSRIEITSQTTQQSVATPEPEQITPTEQTSTSGDAPEVTPEPTTTPEPTPTPTPEPTQPVPDYAGYDAAYAALRAATIAANNALVAEFNKAYLPNDTSVSRQVAYNCLQGNVANNNAKLAADQQALKAQYNIP